MQTVIIFCIYKKKKKLSQLNNQTIIPMQKNIFRALFTTPLNENGLTNFYIPGFRGIIMEKIIDYAYKRTFEISPEDAYELLICSEYCLISGLVKKCCDFIIGMLTPANCVGLMLFAR